MTKRGRTLGSGVENHYLPTLTCCSTIYSKLSSAFVDEIREVYEQRVQELVPNMRYCAYNIGDESAMDDLRQMRIKTGGGKEDALTSTLDVSD